MTIRLRAALPHDALDIAQLVNIAGEGLPAALWTGLAAPNEDVMDVGAVIISRDYGEFSWRNVVIAEVGGAVAGMMSSFITSAQVEPLSADTHPAMRPLAQLQNQARNTRYINAFATFDQFRSHGIAQKLIARAEDDPGPAGMSLILTNGNTRARDYYTESGYREVAQAPLIKANWETPNTTWHLLRKT